MTSFLNAPPSILPPLFCHQSYNPHLYDFLKVTCTCLHSTPKVNWTPFALMYIITPHPKHSRAAPCSRAVLQARPGLIVFTCDVFSGEQLDRLRRWPDIVVTQWKAVCSGEWSLPDIALLLPEEPAERTEFPELMLNCCVCWVWLLCALNAKSLMF